MTPVGEANFLARKKLAAAAIVSDFGRGEFHWGVGGCGYGVTMLMMEVVGNDGGGRVEGFKGGGKGERNGRQRGDNR